MGLFDFFKKGFAGKEIAGQQTEAVDNNAYLIEILKNRLLQSGYKVDMHPHYAAVIVDPEIEIATIIIDHPDNHPNILHIMILTIHPLYFPRGIKENIAGIGTTIGEKVNSVIDNYINTTFQPIMDSFSDSHDPALDFSANINGKEVLWHPKLGNLSFQGQWDEQPQNEPLYEIVKDKLKTRLSSNKLNWLKLYISKRADGTIIGECLFNNEPWEEGLADIRAYAGSWNMKSDFQGIKQFIMFRRCDAFD